MQVLKRIALMVVFLLVLALIKWWFDRSPAVYADFFRNLVANVQLLVLILVVTVTSIQWVFRKKLNNPAGTLKISLALLVFLAAVEILTGYLIRNSHRIPGFLRSSFIEYYGNYGRNQVEFDPECAQYDSRLSYILRPGRKFEFNNYEFASNYSTNRLGLRDSEPDLDKPEIICAGDSHTMGWGVEQDQNYPAVLQELTGLKTLNAGISSYGTAREMLSLQRLDLSNLKFLIIQYCGNDLKENQTFAANGYRLPVMSNRKFDSLSRTLQWRRVYYPFRHTLTISRFFISGFIREKKAAPDTRSESGHEYVERVRLFREIIDKATHLPKDVTIIVTDITGIHPMEEKFIFEFDKQIKASTQDRKYISLNLAPHLRPEEFYVLDGHVKPAGHHRIATLLSDIIRKNLDRK